MSERWYKTFTLYEGSQYDKGFPDDWTLPTFIGWLQGLMEKIPEEFRDSSTVSISSDSEYDNPHANLEISYRREETDEEWAERDGAHAAQAAAQRTQDEQRERAIYEQLKAKYGR